MMKSVHDVLREHFLSGRLFLPCPDRISKAGSVSWQDMETCPVFEDMVRDILSPWCCDEFLQLMRNRLQMGSFRYGNLQTVSSRPMNCIAACLERWQRYGSTGNLECLVDAGNCALLEFCWHRWHLDLNRGECPGVCGDSVERLFTLYRNTEDPWILAQLAGRFMQEFAFPSREDAFFEAVDDGKHN